jgi:hypothetical protein
LRSIAFGGSWRPATRNVSPALSSRLERFSSQAVALRIEKRLGLECSVGLGASPPSHGHLEWRPRRFLSRSWGGCLDLPIRRIVSPQSGGVGLGSARKPVPGYVGKRDIAQERASSLRPNMGRCTSPSSSMKQASRSNARSVRSISVSVGSCAIIRLYGLFCRALLRCQCIRNSIDRDQAWAG